LQKLRYTDKGVQDNNQTAVLLNGKIIVTNRYGRRVLGKYEIDVIEWDKLENSYGNPHYNRKQFIAALNRKTFPDNYRDIEQDTLANRIEDSQIRAINNIYQQYKRIIHKIF
jgi:hypothetical protein